MKIAAVLMLAVATLSPAAFGQALMTDQATALASDSRSTGDAARSLAEYRAIAQMGNTMSTVSLPDVSNSDDPLVARMRSAMASVRERGLGEGTGAPWEGAAPILEGLAATVPAPFLVDRATYCYDTFDWLCLLGRFLVIAEFSNPYLGPQTFDAGAMQLTFESGYMWWESPTVMEVPIKMVNFCGSERTIKIFAAGLTNFYVVVAIGDMLSDRIVTITNPAYNVFDTVIADTSFPCY